MKKSIRSELLFIVCILALLLTACSPNYSKKLQGSWYDGSSEQYRFYSDGTCEISGHYGTGTWSVIDGDTLKISDYYGETATAKIVSVENGCLTLKAGDYEAKFYDTAQ